MKINMTEILLIKSYSEDTAQKNRIIKYDIVDVNYN